MKLCSYVVKIDSGFAPNPFWGWCTLAVCTPNHMGIKLDAGDWIMGCRGRAIDNRLVYAMEVTEKVEFDDYFHDCRFREKKPDPDGEWRKRCGDNMYYVDGTVSWRQLPSLYHATPEERAKDLKHPFVYISREFYYFGDHAPLIPDLFTPLVWRRQGTKCKHAPDLVSQFIAWLRGTYQPGLRGQPRDKDSYLGATPPVRRCCHRPRLPVDAHWLGNRTSKRCR